MAYRSTGSTKGWVLYTIFEEFLPTRFQQWLMEPQDWCGFHKVITYLFRRVLSRAYYPSAGSTLHIDSECTLIHVLAFRVHSSRNRAQQAHQTRSEVGHIGSS